MKIESHIESFKEHKETIFDWGLKTKGLKNSQRIIGLHCSRAIIDLLSIYLLEKNKMDVSKHINHRWFKSKKVEEKLPEFPNKKEIIHNINELEILCEKLAYGAPQSEENMKKALDLFNNIEKEIEELRKDEKK